MEPFHASLADEDGQAIAEVEGTIESPEEAAGAARAGSSCKRRSRSCRGCGQEDLRLQVDGGDTLTIKVDSVSTGSRSGYSEAVFSTV